MFNTLRRIAFVSLVVCALPAPLLAETPLGSQMDTMKGALRSLRAALQAPVDSDKTTYSGYVDTLLSAAAQAKDLEPEMTSTLPEDARTAFVADYRQSIEALIALLQQLKTQVSAGDWDAARAQMRLINEAQANGHEKFRTEES